LEKENKMKKNIHDKDFIKMLRERIMKYRTDLGLGENYKSARDPGYDNRYGQAVNDITRELLEMFDASNKTE
jgi:hypothetical protein